MKSVFENLEFDETWQATGEVVGCASAVAYFFCGCGHWGDGDESESIGPQTTRKLTVKRVVNGSGLLPPEGSVIFVELEFWSTSAMGDLVNSLGTVYCNIGKLLLEDKWLREEHVQNLYLGFPTLEAEESSLSVRIGFENPGEPIVPDEVVADYIEVLNRFFEENLGAWDSCETSLCDVLRAADFDVQPVDPRLRPVIENALARVEMIDRVSELAEKVMWNEDFRKVFADQILARLDDVSRATLAKKRGGLQARKLIDMLGCLVIDMADRGVEIADLPTAIHLSSPSLRSVKAAFARALKGVLASRPAIKYS